MTSDLLNKQFSTSSKAFSFREITSMEWTTEHMNFIILVISKDMGWLLQKYPVSILHILFFFANFPLSFLYPSGSESSFWSFPPIFVCCSGHLAPDTATVAVKTYWELWKVG